MEAKIRELVVRQALTAQWLEKIADFLERRDVEMIGDSPGTYSAGALCKELEIRQKSVTKAGIAQTGFQETIAGLAAVNAATGVTNYTFKSNGQTAVIYLDSAEDEVLGALLIADRT